MRRGPTREQIKRRRRVAAGVFGLAVAAIVYFSLAATVFAPADAPERHGARIVHLSIHSKAVGRDLGVNVLVPPQATTATGMTAPKETGTRTSSTKSFRRWYDVSGSTRDSWRSAASRWAASAPSTSPSTIRGCSAPSAVTPPPSGSTAPKPRQGPSTTPPNSPTGPGAHEGGYWDSHWSDYQRFYIDARARCG